MHKEEEQRLRELVRPATGQSRGPACPALADLVRLAAGTAPPDQKETWMEHAAGCDSCGRQLREVLEDLAEPMGTDEMKFLSSLPSSGAVWQKDLAGRLAGTRRPRPATMWLAWAASLVVAVGAGWYGYTAWRAGQPEQLMAAAYTAQRPFEFRLPGAEHGPVRIEKSPAGSFARPAALLEAEGIIARELEKSPEDAGWLALRARAEILGWDPEAAIATLTRALERKPEDAALLASLGVAHALRAESADRAIDYGAAMEYLSRSLKAAPNTPEVIFNLAVVLERMHLYDQAAEEWRKYLALDDSGGWADEARRRLEAVEQKKKSAAGR